MSLKSFLCCYSRTYKEIECASVDKTGAHCVILALRFDTY